MHIFARVDIKSVTVGIGPQVDDGQIIITRCQKAEVAAMQNRNIPMVTLKHVFSPMAASIALVQLVFQPLFAPKSGTLQNTSFAEVEITIIFCL